MPEKKTCSVCGGPLTLRNAYGICKNTPQCVAARDRLSNSDGPKPKPLCLGCGKYLTKLRIEQNKRKCGPCEQKAKKASAERMHRWGVAKRYGLQPGEYEALYFLQNGRCAICARATGKSRRLSVDHDHKKTGREAVRGLLCAPCNRMLGNARDNPEFFRRAVQYLTSPPAPAEIKPGPKQDEYLIRYDAEWLVVRRLKDDVLARGPIEVD